MSRRLMNDFIQLEAKATVAIEPDVALPTNQQMLLTPNDLCDLTPFGINKVLNKELPVVLQVIDIMEETLTAREKVTLIEPDGSTTFFFADAQKPHCIQRRQKQNYPL